MDTAVIARQQPRNLDEALRCMHTMLVRFHGHDDRRAVFLRLYYIMTLEVHAAVNGLGDYHGKTIFLDPGWIARLSGIFCGLYCSSLDTFARPPDTERAWKITHETAATDDSTVVQNALLGINAHINYDLAYAIARNLVEHDDLANPSAMVLRKFDHDQVNNLLLRSMPYIQDVLARDYGSGIALMDQVLGRLDEELSARQLKYYRERVWSDALAFAAVLDTAREGVVRDKLNWESYKVARALTGTSLQARALWLPENVLGLPRRLLGWPKRYGDIELESEGGVSGGSAQVRPFA